jgi:hypothetical protein
MLYAFLATDYGQLTMDTARFAAKKNGPKLDPSQIFENSFCLQLGFLRSPDAGDGSLECGFSPEKIHFILPLFETLLSPFPGSPRPF